MGTHPIFESDFDCLTDEEDLSRLTENVSLLLQENCALNEKLAQMHFEIT